MKKAMKASSPAQQPHAWPAADPMHARFVPLNDSPHASRIYDPSLLTFGLLGALAGGLLLGWVAYAVAEGSLPVAGLGQFAAAGWGVATFTGAGVGVALGGLTGGLIALLRLPRAKRRQHQHGHSETSHSE